MTHYNHYSIEMVLTLHSGKTCSNNMRFSVLLEAAQNITNHSFSIDWLEWYSEQINEYLESQIAWLKGASDRISSTENFDDVLVYIDELRAQYGSIIFIQQMTDCKLPNDGDWLDHAAYWQQSGMRIISPDDLSNND